jgi:putative N6-adenine-specific DNA methylase
VKILIKTLAGLEDILAEEVAALGASQIKKRKRAIVCEGDLTFLYSANLNLRTALKVLLPIYEFKARTEHELYDRIYDHDWSQYLEKHQTFAIDNTVFSEYFRHSKYAALKAKDAIVDQFRKKFGQRPSVNVEYPDVQFNLHAFKDNFSVSLDSSGAPLNQRGYRNKGHAAPLNEVLAAGMIKLAGWTPEKKLLDPMCGTGTILTEAAMMAYNIPPNIHRKDFGFRGWNDFEPMLWHRIKMEAESKIRKIPVDISGFDIDRNAVALSKRSFKAMDLGRDISVRHADFFTYKSRGTFSGMLITNPPYGERIGEEINDLYKNLGDQLKQNFQGGSAWILSSNKSALKNLRLRPEEKIPLYNGSLACEFCKYELF